MIKNLSLWCGNPTLVLDGRAFETPKLAYISRPEEIPASFRPDNRYVIARSLDLCAEDSVAFGPEQTSNARPYPEPSSSIPTQLVAVPHIVVAKPGDKEGPSDCALLANPDRGI